MPKVYKPFKLSEVRFIESNYKTLTDQQIAGRLGRTAASIHDFRNRNGLAKAKGFPKGHTPWNTGKPTRCNPGGEFKKGHTPARAKQDGETTIMTNGRSRYHHIRISGKWIRLHRHIWEQAHGPIPAGHIIIFRNCDTLDCRMENLELVSRAEFIKRNENREKAGATLRQIWQKVQILEANGRPHRYGFRSKYSKKTETKNAA